MACYPNGNQVLLEALRQDQELRIAIAHRKIEELEKLLAEAKEQLALTEEPLPEDPYQGFPLIIEHPSHPVKDPSDQRRILIELAGAGIGRPSIPLGEFFSDAQAILNLYQRVGKEPPGWFRSKYSWK